MDWLQEERKIFKYRPRTFIKDVAAVRRLIDKDTKLKRLMAELHAKKKLDEEAIVVSQNVIDLYIPDQSYPVEVPEEQLEDYDEESPEAKIRIRLGDIKYEYINKKYENLVEDPLTFWQMFEVMILFMNRNREMLYKASLLRRDSRSEFVSKSFIRFLIDTLEGNITPVASEVEIDSFDRAKYGADCFYRIESIEYLDS